MGDVFDMPAADGMKNDDMYLAGGTTCMKVGEEKEIGSEGLKKKLLKEGDGWDTPEIGDEVQVHYTGTLLDGTKFGSSRDRGEPFKFTLGQGQVIKGCDQGIKTMKKGENAIFTIPPALAYGESGSPPTVPPNGPLHFDVELLSWVSVKDICKDGGIFKKILADGEKWENPKDLDEVLVNYEAKLEDGSVVSKLDGAEFSVQEGYFCPALSKAVKTMKKGEKVLLTVKPQCQMNGLGESGKPASCGEEAVPPNATLNIVLELVSWKRVSHITYDKKVVKKILKEGEGSMCPKGAIAKVRLIGRLQDGTVFVKKGHSNNEEDLFLFRADYSEEVIDGMHRAVLTMKEGEVAVLTIAPEYAFGEFGMQEELATVPPDSTLYYEVELVSFYEDMPFWDKLKIKAVVELKEEGNALFEAGKYGTASIKYMQASKLIEPSDAFGEEDKKQAKALEISCNLNNAACKLKMKEFEQAEKLCTKVLELDSINVTALYRRAQACMNMGDLDLAEIDFKKALQIDPDNREVKLQYKALQEHVKDCNQKLAKLYGNMFANFTKSGGSIEVNGAHEP